MTKVDTENNATTLKKVTSHIDAIENKGINTENEKSLHYSIKKYLYRPGDRLEAKVDEYFIDIVRGDLLIEVQTKNFSAIKAKLYNLLQRHKIQLIYPIAVEKYITLLDKDNSIISRRKSPKKGRLEDLFSELIRIPDLVLNSNLSIIVMLIKEEEIRCNNGLGSWRRKGISLVDRQLSSVLNEIIFLSPEDYLKIIPSALSSGFTNKQLAAELKITRALSTKITYSLKKMGLIHEVGRLQRELLYVIS